MRKWQMNRKSAALLLAAAVTVSLCPFTTDAAADSGRYFTIMEIDGLPEETARQTIALGSPVEEAQELLPDRLTVRGYWNKEDVEDGETLGSETLDSEEGTTTVSADSGQTDDAIVPPPPYISLNRQRNLSRM